MASFMGSYQGQTYALMRIVLGFTFLFHGTQKLLNFPADFPYPLTGALYAAGTIELVGGVLLMIGLATSWVAFLCSGLMAVAYWMAHGMKELWPLQNGGELAVVYCFAFLYISARGAGMWSVDGARGQGYPGLAE